MIWACCHSSPGICASYACHLVDAPTLCPAASKTKISVDRDGSTDRGSGSSVFHRSAIAPTRKKRKAACYRYRRCTLRQRILAESPPTSWVDTPSLADTERRFRMFPGTSSLCCYFRASNPSGLCVFRKHMEAKRFALLWGDWPVCGGCDGVLNGGDGMWNDHDGLLSDCNGTWYEDTTRPINHITTPINHITNPLPTSQTHYPHHKPITHTNKHTKRLTFSPWRPTSCTPRTRR